MTGQMTDASIDTLHYIVHVTVQLLHDEPALSKQWVPNTVYILLLLKVIISTWNMDAVKGLVRPKMKMIP